jgi:hypothetical protein
VNLQRFPDEITRDHRKGRPILFRCLLNETVDRFLESNANAVGPWRAFSNSFVECSTSVTRQATAFVSVWIMDPRLRIRFTVGSRQHEHPLVSCRT